MHALSALVISPRSASHAATGRLVGLRCYLTGRGALITSYTMEVEDALTISLSGNSILPPTYLCVCIGGRHVASM